MFKWLMDLSKRTSEKNIREILPKLIKEANRIGVIVERTMMPVIDPREKRELKRLQNALMIELCGPLEPEYVRDYIMEPVLKQLDASEGAQVAVRHCFMYTFDRNYRAQIDAKR